MQEESEKKDGEKESLDECKYKNIYGNNEANNKHKFTIASKSCRQKSWSLIATMTMESNNLSFHEQQQHF